MVDIVSSERYYGDPATRRRILDVALELAAELGPSMRLADVSAAAGISHQGLYLHFRGRDALLLGLLAHMEETWDFETRYQQVTGAVDGVQGIDEMVAFMTQLNLRLDTVGWVLEEVQYLDEAFGRDYQRRVSGLREAIQNDVVRRLYDEGHLRPEWNISQATDLFLITTTHGTWKDLTRELAWTPLQYTQNASRLLKIALLTNPPTDSSSSAGKPPSFSG